MDPSPHTGGAPRVGPYDAPHDALHDGKAAA